MTAKKARKIRPSIEPKPDVVGAPDQAVLETASETTDKGSGNPHFADRGGDQEEREKTLYLKLDQDGNPLWSRMTPRTLETWKQIFQHPVTGSQFSTEAIPPEDKGAKPADVAALVGWLASGQAMIFSRMTGLPLADAFMVCAWTEEERNTLEPRAARLMNKYGGEFVSKYGDEIFFASTLAVGMAKRFQACRTLAAEYAQREAARAQQAANVNEEKKVDQPIVQ